jgi:hypothetical protein
MAARYFDEPVKREEDERLLTGQALFVDDVEPVGPVRTGDRGCARSCREA